MTAIIHELNKTISKRKPREEMKEILAEDIKEAVSIPEFYKLGLDVVSDILDKSDIIDSDSISNIISFGYKEYGDKVLVLLPHIKCEKLSKPDKIESILKSMEFIPIIREVNMVIHGKEDEDEEGKFEVDWENEYKELQMKYEMMEKKISISKQLLVRCKNAGKKKEPREYTEKEIDKIESIVEDEDVNGAIEVFLEDPNLI